MHGRGCGGSSEWLATLKRHRAAMNKKIAEQQRLMERPKQTQHQRKATNECIKVADKPSTALTYTVLKKEMMINVTQFRQRRCGARRKDKAHSIKEKASQSQVTFDQAPNKCLQKAILVLAQNTTPNVHALLLRMFRASCANASNSGLGCGRQGEANLYSTQHELRYIGAYVLVHESDSTLSENDVNSATVFCFGSTFGFCLGCLAWNSETHHVEPYFAEGGQRQITLGSVKDFAPWELSYVGTKKARRTERQ